MATLLVGGLCVVAMDTAGSAMSSGVRVADRSRGTLLAQDLLSEIMTQEYSDPDGVKATLGIDAAEVSGGRSTWDDVDDYDGWVGAPPQQRSGIAIADLTGWQRTVEVVWVDRNDFSILKNIDHAIKRITVTVDRDGLPMAELTALRTVGLPPPRLAPTVLLVVTNTISPTANETSRKAMIESWGFIVDLIGASESQAQFDAAVSSGAKAVYVPTDISPTDLGTKLSAATIGVVNEHADLADEFGFSSSVATDSSTVIIPLDGTHYITNPFTVGTQLTIFTSTQPVWVLNGTIGSGLTFLGGQPQGPLSIYSFSARETGTLGHDDVAAPGRRVELPWGLTGFDFGSLNADGQTIMMRSITWAAELDAP